MTFRTILLGMSALMSSLIALPALAQATDKSATLEEIVVTAQKTEQNLQKTPLAVQAVSGDALARANITDQADLQKVVPGLRMSKFGSFSNTFLRGLGQGFGQAFANNKIATNLDGVYLTRFLVSSTYAYDMDRVEVVKGPQGTLYGRNATGGALNFITRRPEHEFGGAASLQVGNYDAIQVGGALNVPVTDDLMVRAAFQSDRHDGYLSDGGNDEDTVGARVRVLYEPTDNLSALVTANYYRSEYLFVSNVPVRADGSYTRRDDPWYYPVDIRGLKSSIESKMVYGELNWNILDGLKLTWIPSYAKVDWLMLGAIIGTANRQDISAHQHSEEVRLTGSTDRLNWVGGAYYYLGTNYTGPNSGVFIPTGPNTFIQSGGPFQGRDFIRERSWAVYAQGTYSVTDAFRFTLGARSSWDRKSGVQTRGVRPYVGTVFPFAVRPVAPGVVTNVTAATIDDKSIDWRVGVEYDLSPTSMAYANISTGYLQGGFTNGTVAVPINFFGPENLISYEVGVKNRFLDNRLQLNATAFYYDYRDLQLQAIDNTASALYLNAPKSEIYGAELETMFAPTAADRFEVNLSLLHAEIKKFQPNAAQNFAGFELPMAPKYTIVAAYQHTFDLANGGALTPRVDGTFVGPQWAAFNHPPGSRIKATQTYNANVRYQPPEGKWSIMAYVNNISNEAVRGTGGPGWFGYPDPEGKGFALNATGGPSPPRTYGVRFDARF